MSDYNYRHDFLEFEIELPDPIKVRKDHKCDNCNVVIKKGELAIFQSGRYPRYKDGDQYGNGVQIGIEYWKSYIHEDSSICDKTLKGDKI